MEIRKCKCKELKSKEKEDLKEELTQQSVVEQKDSIKVSKNSKGFNYEFRLVARDGIDLLKQVDHVQKEMEKRIKKWEEGK